MQAKILWFDHRDGHGIAIGSDNKEYYIDSSAIPKHALKHLNNGIRIELEENLSIKHCRCARVVKVNLQDCLERYRITLTKLEKENPEHLRPEAIPDTKALIKELEGMV